MKLKLNQLKVQSFVTTVDKNELSGVKGGELTGTETQQCPTVPINTCNTIGEIHCVLSVERCTNIVIHCI